MNWIHYSLVMTLVASCWGEAEITNEITHKSNEKLDANLRKALLKALNDLQAEDPKTHPNVQKLVPASAEIGQSGVFQKKLNSSNVVTVTPNIKPTTEKITIIQRSTVRPTIKPVTQKSTIQPTTEKVTKPVVVIQKSSGYQEKPITTYISHVKSSIDPIRDIEHRVPSISSSTTRSPKYDPYNSVQQNIDTVLQLNRPNNVVSITEKSRITQSTNPTAIVPIITPSTEEYQAKVENIQFFQAPLVAAFTVHHDSIGFPQSIVPIYKASTEIPIVNKNSKEQERLRQEYRQKQETEKYKKEQLKLQQYLSHQEQIRIQSDLAQKQSYVEQQIKFIQQQRQHQDYLLRQQQLQHEQQLLQQRQNLINEQKTLFKNSHNSQPALINNINKNQNPLPSHIGSRDLSTSISFEPSISFHAAPQIQNTLLPPFPPSQNNFLNTQFPPLLSKPINFNQNNLIPGSQQSFKNTQSFSSLNKHNQAFQQNRFNQPIKSLEIAPSVQTQKPLQAFDSFNKQNLQSIRGLQGLENPQKLAENNRVIRHELGTGNFVNTNYNNFNNYNTIQQLPQVQPQGNRFFRSNTNSVSLGTNPNEYQSNYFLNQNYIRPSFADSVNNDLNKLLLYSGVNLGKQEEDLSIVSKVLSLNHLGTNNYYIKPHNFNQRLKPSYRGF